MKLSINHFIWAIPFVMSNSSKATIYEQSKDKRPNIIIIYTDDLGYGDIGCYGATRVNTPEIDRLASNGLRFKNAYSTSATCTPSRYGLLTGQYPWRKPDTNIAKGDASMIIKPGTTTISSVLKKAGYSTAVIGKWHLGLGSDGGPNWNDEIKPGPEEIGFDYTFLIPATGDRVPCVFVENRKVVGLDPSDLITVSFNDPLGDEPTGKHNPELLKMMFNHGHDKAIVNGISRIGYMKGGNAARWRDEDIADVITKKALSYIEKNKENKFFLYFSTHDIHVPRVPHERFAGKNVMGPRGDVIVQLDWCVGEIMKKLDELMITDNTLIIFSSDNGPVLDDGYHDNSVELLGDHKPAGPLRGAKYSSYEGGTRVPFIVHWPGVVKPGLSSALFSQIDLLNSLGALAGITNPKDLSPDGYDNLPTLLGKNRSGRKYIIEQNAQRNLAIVKGNWKFIEPNSDMKININTVPNIEFGNDPLPQLYNLSSDVGERNNLANIYPKQVSKLKIMLEKIKDQ